MSRTRARRPTVAIVGLGLVGGSLARGLTRAGYRVIGVDRRAVLRRARAAGAFTAGTTRAEDAAALADVIVLAAPPRANLALLRRLARSVRADGPLVTDVGSVKVPICAAAVRLGVRFVGGHPVAGNERSGFAASSPDLFRGRAWVLTPATAASGDRARVAALARAVGARPVRLLPDEHDRTLAFLSHAPQVMAWALFEAAGADPVARRYLALAGPGFRDMTRLARSPRALWREILSLNRREVRRAVSAVRRGLTSLFTAESAEKERRGRRGRKRE
jgi:prephenate dehydrogenase